MLSNRTARGRCYVHVERSILGSSLSCISPSNLSHFGFKTKICNDNDELSLQYPGKSAYWSSYHHASESEESGWLCRNLAVPRWYYLYRKNILLCVYPLLFTQNWHFWSPNGWGVFPTPINSLQHQLGVLQFHSIPTLSTWRQHQIPQVKGSVPQAATLHCRRQSPVIGSHLYFWSTACK